MLLHIIRIWLNLPGAPIAIASVLLQAFDQASAASESLSGEAATRSQRSTEAARICTARGCCELGERTRKARRQLRRTATQTHAMWSQQPSILEQLGVLPGTPSGSEVKLGGVDCYVARPTSATTPLDTTKVLVCVPDQFGWRFTPQRVVADYFAAELGVTVVLPDVHDGDSISPHKLDYVCALPPSWMSADTHKWWMARYMSVAGLWIALPIIVWGFNHMLDLETTLKPLKAVIKAARQPQAEGGLGCARVAVLGVAGFAARSAFALGGAVVGVGADAVVAMMPDKMSDVECAEVAKCCVPSMWVFKTPDAVDPNATTPPPPPPEVQRADVEGILAQRPAARRAHVSFAELTHGFSLVLDLRPEMQAYKPEETAKSALARDSIRAVLAEAVGFLKEHFLPMQAYVEPVVQPAAAASEPDKLEAAPEAAAAPAEVRHVGDSAAFRALLDEAKAAGKPVLVDFFATWCGPCKTIAPLFLQLARDTPGVIFAKVDVDAAQDVAKEAAVSAMPTFQLFKEGAKVDELRGADAAGLKRMVQAAL